MSNRFWRVVLGTLIVIGSALLRSSTVSAVPAPEASVVEAVTSPGDLEAPEGITPRATSALWGEQAQDAWREEEWPSGSLLGCTDWTAQQEPMSSSSPDDRVRIVAQLEGEPLALCKVRLRTEPDFTAGTYEHGIRVYVDLLREGREELKKAIGSLGLNAIVIHEYWYAFNGLSLIVKQEDVGRIRALPFVTAVYPDSEVHALLDESVPLIGAPEVWAMRDGSDQLVTGKGIDVAILDTG